MAGQVLVERRDGIVLIRVDNPPVNALNLVVREALHDLLAGLAAEPGLKGVVLAGAGGRYIAGGDIKEFHIARIGPPVRDLARLLENLDVPVVCAIQGAALGGGLELALACHYRIATPASTFGLPEVGLGIIAGGGGTQRLPRLIGLEPALDLILSAEAVDAPRALSLGIVDEIRDGDVVDAALEAVSRVPVRRSGAMPVHAQGDPLAVIAGWRARVKEERPNEPAPGHALDSVEQGIREGLEVAIAADRNRFTILNETPESKALRYNFFAERAAMKSPPGLGGRADAVPAVDLGPKLVELRRDGAADADVAAALTRAKRAGKLVVITGPSSPPASERLRAADRAGRLVEEGRRLLAEGAVARAGDIDVICVHALGYPRHRGGPMYQAELAASDQPHASTGSA